jgi:hypothetical protein
VGLPQLIEHGTISASFYKTAFKFTFVRNPFDRAVSLFLYLKKIRNAKVCGCQSFLEFCTLLEKGFPPVGFYNYFSLNQCNPMTSWIFDSRGDLIADFIGRVENIKNDWHSICELTGLSGKIEVTNKIEHKHYRTFYCKTSKNIIKKLYCNDIDYFGYGF